MIKRAQGLQLAGIVAAVVLAFLVNLLSSRHPLRWDWTSDKRWTLSPATMETLRTLEQPVDVWVITTSDDPVDRSLKDLLASYRASSSRIEVHYIDPDRDVSQLVALQARFGLQGDSAEDGRVATRAVVVLASGDKHWFLTTQELFEQADDDVHVKPREERALTQGLRSVLEGERAKLCFTAGHGELPLAPTSDEARESLSALRDLLQKNNYELATVDVTDPAAHDPFAGCTVVVIAGMRAPFAPEEANRLRAWLLQGGSLLSAIGPLDPTQSVPMPSTGLADVLGPFGIALDDDLVYDAEPGASIPDTHGEGFFVSARPHPTTVTLVGAGPDAHPPRIAAFHTRSLRHIAPRGSVGASDLLVTTDAAYAKSGVSASAETPSREPGNPPGPFAVAMASERPRIGPSTSHGPRVVVLGSRYFLAEENWKQPRTTHGAAFLVDSALSWLSARPEVVDVPERAEVAAGMRVSEQGRSEVERYVLLFMPLAAALLGLTVWAWRRSSENKPYTPDRAKEPPA